MTQRWRRGVAVLAAAGAIILIALAVALHDRRSTRFDSAMQRELYRHVTGTWPRVLLDLSDPLISISTLTLILLVSLACRRWTLAVIAVVPTTLGSALVEWVLKPLVHRLYGTYSLGLSFPSGHETLAASTAFVVALALGQLPLRTVLRAVYLLVLAAWLVGVGVGLVVNFWHYTTDTVGAVGLSAALVLGSALLADRLSSPGGRGRSRTARAA